MAALAALVVLACFALAYRLYARFLGERVFEDGDVIVTPAHALADGHDFVATPMHLLQGHHFTSIAGAAPIIGPCVAAYWGWAPALVWVVVGTIFMGAAHDFGALVVSARERGRSVADIAGSVIGPRARLLFLCFVIIIVWLVLAVFAMAIAGLFVSQPASVIPINIEIVVAALVGWWIYRRRGGALWPSLLALAVLYGAVFVGVKVPVDFVALGVERTTAVKGWMLFLFAYSALASLLPVWLLLQPRDLINSHQLAVGLLLLFVGLFVSHPSFDAPALRTTGDGAPPIFPVLFVTIACGAISGFHGLVSSGTTSKQLDRLRDARPIGYGSMLGEGTLALLATLAAVAGIGLVGSCTLPGQGAVADLSWGVYYESWGHASVNNASAFVLGGGAFLEAIGFPTDVARTLMAVLVISFAATTLDTATRIQRFIFAELGSALSFRPFENAYVGTALAVLPAMALAFAETTDPATGQSRAVGWVLWPIFGASNQLLAALTLMVIALYVHRRGRPAWPLLVPMLLVIVIATLALVGDIATFFAQGNALLAGIASGLLVLLAGMLFEGLGAARRPTSSDPA
ncbi:MAG: carbon starvation protein A [Myxococcales bacterium]|nr:carbon starvation protein A [Myxococcales bacterium]MCB9627722.1 carbon starvation protein A [Sandaracinaceae bacterium]